METAHARVLVSPFGHPRFRGRMVRLVFVGALAAALAYLTNHAIALFSAVLLEPDNPDAAPGFVRRMAGANTSAIPWLGLGLFATFALLQSALSYVYNYGLKLLIVDSIAHIETTILRGLLRKRSEFFVRHDQAEILSRLTTDARRAARVRPEVAQGIWFVLLLVGNLAYFAAADVLLALLLLGICMLGAYVGHRLMRPLALFDRDILRAEEAILSRLKEALAATDEVKVTGLHHRVVSRLEASQETRHLAMAQFYRLDTGIATSVEVFRFVALAALLCVVGYQAQHDGASTALPLLSVVVWAVPAVYASVSQLVPLVARLRLARTSVERIAEYMEPGLDGPEPLVVPEPTAASAPVTLAGVSYRYRSHDGSAAAGIVGVDLALPQGTWTAIVGASGSGKSTLLKVMLGLIDPDEGSCAIATRELETFGPAERAALFAYVPQTPVMIDGSVLDNLAIGVLDRELSPGVLDELDRDVLERSGVAELCRARALDLRPDAAGASALTQALPALREKIAAAIRTETGVALEPLLTAVRESERLVVEHLVGRCGGHGLIAEHLLAPVQVSALARALPKETRRFLLELVAILVAEYRPLFELEDYATYARLASRPASSQAWRARRDVARASLTDEHPDGQVLQLALVVALTTKVAELPPQAFERLGEVTSWQARHAAAESLLTRLLEPVSATPDAQHLNPHLTWKENLVFGQLPGIGHRQRQRVDNALWTRIQELGLADTLLERGLTTHVGVDGQGLSGGQRQMIALCRALLRRSPIVALDEPTSALDPASRDRFIALLQSWKRERVIVSISHDPAFIECADRVALIETGRLTALGPYAELHANSPAFRGLMGGG